MTTFVIIVLFALSIILTAMLVALGSLSYSFVKYWARRHDHDANALYPLKVRGNAVVITLELLRALAVTGAVILLSAQLWSILAWLAASVILVLGLLVLPQLYLKPFGTKMLVTFSGPIISLTSLLKPLTGPFGSWLDSHGAGETHIVVTKSELTHLFASTKSDETDLSADELRILKHSLTFGDKTVHDVMTPKRVMKTAKETDVLGPVFLDELHKSGHSRFPVWDEAGEQIVGVLYLRDASEARGHEQVKSLMRKNVFFVHEESELDHVLQAFLRTKRHMFIVTNSFAEVVGLVTIEDVVEQILGKPIIDEFDLYHSMRDVAKQQAREIHKQNREKMVE
jgi:CBS domain containing-hemolysin-like protein